MKRYVLTVMAAVVALAMNAQSLFVGTYNVRNQNDGDARNGNGWPQRCKVICDQMNFEDPDIFGTQEVLIAQLHDLANGLDGYRHIGVGRDDGKEAGEHSAIFYKQDRLKLINHGDFWLNETPDKPKLEWDAACIRICTGGEFEQKQTGFRFFFFNLHMDHVGIVARREAAKLVVKKIGEIAKGAHTILTGDFNVDQKNEIYTIFTKDGGLKDSYVVTRHRFAENGTFNDFSSDMKSDSRIDHVFVTPDFEVERYGVLTDAYWTPDPEYKAEAQQGKNSPKELRLNKYVRRLPSDHYPVLVKLRYTK